MAQKKFSELEAGTVDGTSIFAQTKTENGSLVSKSASSTSLAGYIGTSHQFAGLSTTAKNLVGAINEAAQSGGGASVIQLTQAEYTALSTAEKMNGSIYKLTDKAIFYCLDEEYHAVKELTTAQYNALTSAEKNNGTIYIQTDAETTGSDIPISTGETETIAEMLTTQFVDNFVTLSGSAVLNNNLCSIYGKIHSLRLYFAAVNAGSGWVTQAIVPEGHRPAGGIVEFYLVNEADGFNNAECRITTDGLLQVYSPTSNMKLWGQGWWISA